MIRRLMFCLALGGFSLAVSAEDKQTVEQLEKQVADLQAKLAELKKKTPAASQPAKKPLTLAEADKWRGVATPAVSNDGRWFACRVIPSSLADGEGEVVLRNLADGKETKFLAAFSRSGGFGQLSFSFDSKWLAFTYTPAGSPKGKPKVVLVNLATGEKTELDGFSSVQFSGEAATHVALRKAAESLPPNAPPGASLPTAAGSDLVLRELATGGELVLGNVSEFAFDKKGGFLVMLIDAAGQIGNGVQIRDMKTGGVTPVETGKAAYRSLSWHEDGAAFTVVKAVEDKEYDGKWHTVLGFTDLGPKPTKASYDPKDDKTFPADMGISTNRPATWTRDLAAFVFGIAEQKKKAQPKKETTPTPPPTPPAAGGAKPDLAIWHWKDEKLQPMQQVQAPIERNFTYLCLYHVKDKKFVRLADDGCKSVTLAPKHQAAIGQDFKPYMYQANLDGRYYSDVYVVDVKTGGRKKALTKARYYFGPSPTGTHFLYHDDGHFHVYDLAAGTSKNITAAVKGTEFIDLDDDHNVTKPPTQPVGWSKDGTHVLLSDDWDLWKVAVDGSGGENLTVNGKKDGVRYRGFSQFEPDPREPGFDFAKPAYTSLFGEWTKKSGFGLVAAGKPGVTVLAWNDVLFGPLAKARDADVFYFTKQTNQDSADYYTADATFKDPKKATDANPQHKEYLWSSGTKLVDYKALGKRLQGALYLPANYEPGKKYPTVVYIYEKLSDDLHRYSAPGAAGFNKAIYTANGYAVLTPDITYKLNDPGKSSIECINAALDAAIATGVVDGDKLGLQGHSWGGYQTAFAVTQTNRFKAACAGAPLTDLVSMYSSVYWNTGSANQPIFESSQGRFTAGYWDQQEAYIRNSPVYFAKNVTTPLLMLHNDKDGAVDFTQGVEYYNTLRRLQKPVVMLQYKGENHGLVKPENRKDYSVRMREFFDCYLQGKPAPDWWKDGVPHLKMDDHLKGRR